MGALPQLTRRLKLRHVAFLLLLLSGAIPLAITNWLLIAQNRELLVTEEKSYLTTSAQALSRELGEYLAGARRELEQMGAGTLASPGTGLVAGRVGSFLRLLARDEEPLSVDLAEAVRAEVEWIWLAGPAVRHRFFVVGWLSLTEASCVPGYKTTG